MKHHKIVPTYGALRDPRAGDPARGSFTPKAKADPRRRKPKR